MGGDAKSIALRKTLLVEGLVASCVELKKSE